MSRWTRAKVLFFAGTVAAIANNFERAARHLSHAEHLFRTDPPAAPVREGRHDDLAEVSYLRCVVDRMRMRDSSVFNEARHRLARLAELAQKDSFEYARLMSESGSLFLMRYFNLRFGIEDSTEAGVPDAMIKRSKSFFDEARRASMSVRERRLVDRSLIRALDTQIHTNSICWHIVESGFFDGRTPQLQSDVVTSLGILENVSGRAMQDDHIIGFWEKVANWLTAPPQRRTEEAANVATFCNASLLALKTLGAEHQAPTDAVVFSFVADRASALKS
jgi:hypothetical protein